MSTLLGRIRSTKNGWYRIGLTACILGLFTFPTLERLFDTTFYSYITVLSALALWQLYQLGKNPDYSTRITIDPLTGLLNRESFLEGLDKLVRRKEHVAVITLNIIGFRRLNNSLGYTVGDKLLIQIASRLKASCSPHLVSRIGSDEFAVAFGTAALGYTVVCSTIQQALSDPFIFDGVELALGFSSGVICTNAVQSAPELLRQSTVALVESKRSHVPFVTYRSEFDSLHPPLQSITHELKIAFENSELLFLYQPQFCLKTGKLVGAEALLRWRHPTRGLLGPDYFIPIAEQTGLILSITEWTLREGIRTLAKLQDSSTPIRLSINVSPYVLADGDILTMLTKEIVYNSIKANTLTLEVTESSINRSPESMAKIVACLEMLGINFSIDDFGTGHASLLYLKHVNFKELKIDKTFVSNMTRSLGDQSIVKSTIALAHSFGCSAVAEGIETREVFEQLTDMGCDIAQGYFVSKQITETELFAKLGEQNGRS